MEGRCQYTVFFSAALNLQNIQITDKKLSPISPSFNPCGPCGPQRLPGLHHRGPRRISILAVLADRDARWTEMRISSRYFNPRGPCGPRLPHLRLEALLLCISILAVLADRDSGKLAQFARRIIFQSSRSLRTATTDDIVLVVWSTFQSSRSLRTATTNTTTTAPVKLIFQSSRSLRTATQKLVGLHT